MKNTLKKMLSDSPVHMDILRAVKAIGLPDCWAGGGVIRNHLWDHLHGYQSMTPLNDIDVVYYDPENTTKEIEKEYDGRLGQIMSGQPWSVKNQARMWQIYGTTPYQSTEDGLRCWTEKVTALAARLDDNNEIEILAPFGLEDAFDLIVSPTPHIQKFPQIYNERLDKKSWETQWPKLKIERL